VQDESIIKQNENYGSQKKLAHPLQDGFKLKKKIKNKKKFKKIIEPVTRLNFSGHDASYKLGTMGRVNNINISVQNVTLMK